MKNMKTIGAKNALMNVENQWRFQLMRRFFFVKVHVCRMKETMMGEGLVENTKKRKRESGLSHYPTPFEERAIIPEPGAMYMESDRRFALYTNVQQQQL